MAEQKKEKPKEKKEAVWVSDRKTAEHITFLLFMLLVLGAIVTALLNLLEALINGTLGLQSEIVKYFLEHIWPIWKIIAVIISALSVTGIVYNLRHLTAINILENKIYNPLLATISDEEKIEEPKNERWEKILKLANSDNSSDWRLAIIDADTMLEELLKTSGYVGDSVGEMLKSVDKSEFLTIEDAWEAHKIRNQVAHSGGIFQLNQRETRETIGLFEKVFKEFELI